MFCNLAGFPLFLRIVRKDLPMKVVAFVESPWEDRVLTPEDGIFTISEREPSDVDYENLLNRARDDARTIAGVSTVSYSDKHYHVCGTTGAVSPWGTLRRATQGASKSDFNEAVFKVGERVLDDPTELERYLTETSAKGEKSFVWTFAATLRGRLLEKVA